MVVLLRAVFLFVAGSLLISGCAALQPRDPLQVMVVGIDPLPGQGLEMRMNVKLRVQNPNDQALEYDGIALEMDVQGKTFATGVSDAAGTVPRYGETVITVPVTISAFRMARQAMGLISRDSIDKIEYEMKGKLSSGFSTARFVTKGSFGFPTAEPNKPD